MQSGTGARAPLIRRAVRRASHLLRRTPPAPGPVALALDEVAQLVQEREWDRAVAILDHWLVERPDDLRLLTARADVFFEAGEWSESVTAWRALLATRTADLRPRHWISAVNSLRARADLAEAGTELGRALALHPDHPGLKRLAAEFEMVRQDWPAALDAWIRFLDARRAAGISNTTVIFQNRSRISDWFEAAWHEVAAELLRRGPSTAPARDLDLHAAIARTLIATRQLDDGVAVLESWLAAAGPEDEAAPELRPDIRRLSHRVAMLRLGTRVEFTDLPPEHAELLAALPPAPAVGDGFGPLRLLRVPMGSQAELAVRSARYFQHTDLAPHVQRLARADGWPDAVTDHDPLVRAAHEIALRFGRDHAVEPHLPARTLADAVHLAIYHETSQWRPMRRLAEDLAAADSESLVFLEIPNTSINYLVNPSMTVFSLVYLYAELQQRGVNVFFCQRSRGPVDDEPVTMTFLPKWRSTLVQTHVVEPAHDGGVGTDGPHAHTAIVPAGVRSIPQLIGQLPGSTVYESANVVGEFAYDRRPPRALRLAATARLHPEGADLPSFDFPMTTTTRLPSRGLIDPDESLDAVLEESAPVGGSWSTWLHRAVGPYLEAMARRAEADVAARGITEAHVADYLLPEGVLVGDATKRHGGRVVLHPHSSNPVHIDVRSPDSFDVVEAVTGTGERMWREAFPDKEVRHAPTSMVMRGSAAAYDESQPLSLVLFGGMATMGHTPWIDLDRHAQSYLDLFDGLDDLRRDLPIDVWFKPRGMTGDTETWLFHTVGKRAGWRPTYTHARRLDLPNRVFMSVSVGTSALIEGLADGVPGLIVRDFPVRDYTTLTEDVFPIVRTPDALDFLRQVATAEGYHSVRQRQAVFLRDELGFD